MKYEYKARILVPTPFPYGTAETRVAWLADVANQEAIAGWRLVSVIAEGNRWTVVFERPLPDEPPV